MPMPRRRKFAPAPRASALSKLPALRASMPTLVNYAGAQGTGITSLCLARIRCYGFGVRADCRPAITVSQYSRARRARASTPSGAVGRGTEGAKMFS